MEENKTRVDLETPIQKYHETGLISARAYNICRYNDIETVGDLVLCMLEGNLIKLRNCGKKTLEELKGITALINYEDAATLVLKDDQYNAVPKAIQSIIESNYYNALPGFSDDCIRGFYEMFDSPAAFYSFFCSEQRNLNLRIVAINSVEITNYCYQIISKILSCLKNNQHTNSFTYELFTVARVIYVFSVNHLEADNTKIEMEKRFLLDDFNERASKLSSRAKNIQEAQIPTFIQAISLAQMTENQLNDFLFFKNLKNNHARELFCFIRDLKDVLLQYESKTNDEIIKEAVSKKYPYLAEEQICFVSEYYSQFGHYPMFYLLHQLVLKQWTRQNRVFVMSTGIEGQRKTLEEIGNQFGCTRERIRQILNTSKKDLFKDKEWSHYQFENCNVITQDDKIYKDVVVKEKVDYSFEVFARICSLGFPLKLIKENGMIFLVNERFDKQIIDQVCREAAKHKKNDETNPFNIDTFLKGVSAHKKSDYKQILTIILAKAYGLSFDKDEAKKKTSATETQLELSFDN